MALFSERYGYKKVSDIIIREQITPEIESAICSCYDRLVTIFEQTGYISPYPQHYKYDLYEYIWTYYFNKRLNDFKYSENLVSDYIEDSTVEWYEVLDVIEFTIKWLYKKDMKYVPYRRACDLFCRMLNNQFERLNFAYRIVNCEIVEITSEQEIKAIENAIESSPQNVKMHLNSALEKLAQRPDGDYRNSIKESISAVEAFCREKTGENTLGRALNSLERNNIIIHSQLKSAFEKLYAYTNHPETGIRHCSMDNEGRYTPTADEALFMLVSCSAFVNYLSKKI